MADTSAQIQQQQPSRSRDLDKLLLRPGNLVGPRFEPGAELRDDLQEFAKVLVVGAGGLGCELLKDLALSGFRNLEVIDMDRIEVTNLNRQFLFRLEDVGKPKAEVAAKRVMERISGVNIVPHFCRIEDKEIEFYNDFSIIALGLDSIEARSYINTVACSFLEYDSDDNPREETIKPMVDGGTEGFKGHARVIMPGITPCFECTIWLFPPQVKFPLCTLAETPRTAAHCIEYAHLIKWDENHTFLPFQFLLHIFFNQQHELTLNPKKKKTISVSQSPISMYNHSLMISTMKKHANGERVWKLRYLHQFGYFQGRVKFLDFSSIVTHKSKEELKADPDSDKCYNLTLGPSFKDGSSNKYCTLRYIKMSEQEHARLFTPWMLIHVSRRSQEIEKLQFATVKGGKGFLLDC